MCSLIAGTSKRADLAGLAAGFQLGLHIVDCRAWFGHVESASNMADGGSREGVGDPMAKALHIRLRQFPCPTLPDNFPHILPLCSGVRGGGIRKIRKDPSVSLVDGRYRWWGISRLTSMPFASLGFHRCPPM